MEITSEAGACYDEATGDIAIGDLDAAISKLRRCVALEPNKAEFWQALGMALHKSGNSREGIGAAMMSTTLEPNDLLTWTALSQMYVSLSMIPEAEDAKSKARILSMGGRL